MSFHFSIACQTRSNAAPAIKKETPATSGPTETKEPLEMKKKTLNTREHALNALKGKIPIPLAGALIQEDLQTKCKASSPSHLHHLIPLLALAPLPSLLPSSPVLSKLILSPPSICTALPFSLHLFITSSFFLPYLLTFPPPSSSV